MSNDQLKIILETDPGNPAFAEYADQLRLKRQYSEALAVCLAGLSKNPSFHRGRLVLARVFYECQYLPFAIREIAYLAKELPDNTAIQKLYERLSPEKIEKTVTSISETGLAETVAETEFDIDVLEALEEKG